MNKAALLIINLLFFLQAHYFLFNLLDKKIHYLKTI